MHPQATIGFAEQCLVLLYLNTPIKTHPTLNALFAELVMKFKHIKSVINIKALKETPDINKVGTRNDGGYHHMTVSKSNG